MDQHLILPSTNGALVFGLEWLPLIGRRTESRAYQAARQYSATHLVVDGPDGAAVGLATIAAADRHGGQALHSAARALANAHASGTVATRLSVPDGTFWVVGVHEGTVIAGTDRLYATLEQADAGLADLRQAFPHLRVLDDDAAPQDLSLDSVWAACESQTLLRKVRGRHRGLRVVVLGLMLVLLLWVLLPRLWKAAFAAAPDPAVAIPPVDADAAWRAATARARHGRVVHGVSGTRLVLDAFHDLPVTVAGWSLTGAQCLAKSAIWHCRATYRRVAPDASNESFLAATQRPWTVAFPSLDRARPRWRFPSGAQGLDRFSPDSADYNDRHLASRFQAISSAFNHVQLGKPVLYPVVAPIDDRGGRIARPVSQPRYFTRTVRIKGPLRSAGVLLPYVAPVEWKEIRLAVGSASEPSLTSSQFIVSFEGVLHETD